MPVGYNPKVCKKLREEGFHAESVDHWNAHTRRMHDLFGCIDVLGVGPEGTIAVQVTSRSNMSARVKKLRASEALPFMLAAGWRVEVWGYHKPSRFWELHRVSVGPDVTLD